MTKGFKDKDGKFRPTGNSSNSISSNSVSNNNTFTANDKKKVAEIEQLKNDYYELENNNETMSELKAKIEEKEEEIDDIENDEGITVADQDRKISKLEDEIEELKQESYQVEHDNDDLMGIANKIDELTGQEEGTFYQQNPI
jgi:DNA repair exonuclease SbcCD ATPase subunit